jgi:hypothetical protein
VRRAFLLGLGPAGATRAVLETLARPAWRRVGERNARPAFIYSGGAWVHISRLSCRKSGNREYSCQVGSVIRTLFDLPF